MTNDPADNQSKIRRTPLAMALGLFLAIGACTPTIYGVPQETWEGMSETERIEAMRVYEERKIAYQKARAEKARVRAIEMEKQRAREAEEARQRQVRVEAIYRGKGSHGDLLQVALIEGDARIAGKRRGFEPVHFRIARGEIKTVSLVSGTGRTADLPVAYLDGILFLDYDPTGSRVRGHRLLYSSGWADGTTYAGISSTGPLRLRDVEARVEILGWRPRAGESPAPVAHPQTPSPQVVVIEAPPQVVVVQDSPRRRPEARDVVIDRGGPKSPETEDISHGEEIAPTPRDDAPNPEVAPSEPVSKTPDSSPDRVRVTLRGGTLKSKGGHIPFEPVTLDLQEGESRAVRVLTQGKSPALLLVGYRDGVLYLDGKPGRGSGALEATEIRYDPAWARGKHYRLTTDGALKLRNVSVLVELVEV